jgi:hypothetical protein
LPNRLLGWLKLRARLTCFGLSVALFLNVFSLFTMQRCTVSPAAAPSLRFFHISHVGFEQGFQFAGHCPRALSSRHCRRATVLVRALRHVKMAPGENEHLFYRVTQREPDCLELMVRWTHVQLVQAAEISVDAHKTVMKNVKCGNYEASDSITIFCCPLLY